MSLITRRRCPYKKSIFQVGRNRGRENRDVFKCSLFDTLELSAGLLSCSFVGGLEAKKRWPKRCAESFGGEVGMHGCRDCESSENSCTSLKVIHDPYCAVQTPALCMKPFPIFA